MVSMCLHFAIMHDVPTICAIQLAELSDGINFMHDSQLNSVEVMSPRKVSNCCRL